MTELADDLGTFEIDADKIGAVLVNLLTNAIKFTPDGGAIELTARSAPDENVEIVVEDRGVGLEPEALNHLFQPFFTQFDPSRHSSGDFGFNKRGLGLGLSIAKSFVEMHRWNDRGGEPRWRRNPDHRSPAPPRLLERENLMPTALIVEDEPEANKLLSMLVQLRGYQTESALDGAAALDHLRRQAFDVIFLDLMLPDIDGYDVCRALKVVRNDQPDPGHHRDRPSHSRKPDAELPRRGRRLHSQALPPRRDLRSSRECPDSEGAARVIRNQRRGLRLTAAMTLKPCAAWPACEMRSSPAAGCQPQTIEEIYECHPRHLVECPRVGRSMHPGSQPRPSGMPSREASLHLTVADAAGWLENHPELEGEPPRALVKRGLFDQVFADPVSRTLQLVKCFTPD